MLEADGTTARSAGCSPGIATTLGRMPTPTSALMQVIQPYIQQRRIISDHAKQHATNQRIYHRKNQ